MDSKFVVDISEILGREGLVYANFPDDRMN